MEPNQSEEAKRLEWADNHFYIEVSIEGMINGILITRRKKYYGLSAQNDEEEILPTIYDSISPVNNSRTLEIKIGNLTGFYCLEHSDWIVKPCCEEVVFHDFYQTIEISSQGKHGLIDLKSNRLIIPLEWDDTTITTDPEYLWVKRGNIFSFIEKTTGRVIFAGEGCMAYDTLCSMYVQRNNGQVVRYDSDGVPDDLAMRKDIISNHGRLKLNNYKNHSYNIIDLYGFILN